MKKREAEFTTYFREWLKYKYYGESSVFEIKQTTKDSIPFSALKEHQIDALMSVNETVRGFSYKIPDDSRGVKPFDLVHYKRAPAFVVIKYPTMFCVISIINFIAEEGKSKRKSLTLERAIEIASYTDIA